MENDCTVCDTQLTAFFDGEVSPAELKPLQLHVQSCGRCSEVWQAWSQTQSALRSIRTPAVPSSLLSRVLVACRMTGTENAAGSAFDKQELQHTFAKYLTTPGDEFNEAFERNGQFHPPLAPAFKEVAVPPHLKAAILKKTVEQDVVARRRGLAAPIFWETVTDWVRGWSTPANARWGYGLAIPATFAFMLFAFRPAEVLVETTPPVPQVQKQASAPAVVRDKPTKATVASVPETVRESVAEVAQALTTEEPPSRLAGVSNSVRTSIRNVVTSVSPAPRVAVLPPASVTPSVTQTVTQKAAAPKPPVVRARAIPLTGVAPTQRPQLRAAANSPRIADDTLRRLPMQDQPRISNPAPRLSEPKTLLATVDFDSALEAVRSLRDDRPDDWGQVIDDYRAALFSSQADDEDDEAAGGS